MLFRCEVGRLEILIVPCKDEEMEASEGGVAIRCSDWYWLGYANEGWHLLYPLPHVLCYPSSRHSSICWVKDEGASGSDAYDTCEGQRPSKPGKAGVKSKGEVAFRAVLCPGKIR